MAGRSVVVRCCVLLFAFRAAAVLGSAKLTSITLEPVAPPTLIVGQQIFFKATGHSSDGSTRLLGGMGNPMLWHVVFLRPELSAKSCGTDAMCCQVVIPDADGAFDAVWSENQNVRAVGSVTPTTILANLSCVSGTGTGSLSASWNGIFYSGNAAFDGAKSTTAVKGLTWSSSNASVASVDDRGIVSGNSIGAATIRTTFGGTCWPGVPEEVGDCSGSLIAETTVMVVGSAVPPPDSRLSGTYDGTRTETFEPCHRLPSVTYSGGLAIALWQTGSVLTGTATIIGRKTGEEDSLGQCALVDDPDPEVGSFVGQTDGTVISGMVRFPRSGARAFVAAVSGTTISGAFPGELPEEGMTFTVERTASGIPVPAITNFAAVSSPTVPGTWTLSWSSINAASSSIDQGVGIVPIAGSVTVAPATPTIYTLTSTGIAGRVFMSTTVTVNVARRRAVRH